MLSVYASGDGSLSFVFQNSKGIATGDRVTKRDVEAFVRERRPDLANWRIVALHGTIFKLFRVVERTAPDEVLFDGRAYRYLRRHEQDFDVFDAEGHEIKNLSIKGAIMFYVNNERACDEAIRC